MMSIEDYQIYHIEDTKGKYSKRNLESAAIEQCEPTPLPRIMSTFGKRLENLWNWLDRKLNSFNYLFPTHKRGEEEEKKSAERTRWAEDGGGTEYAKLSMNVLIVAHGPRSPKIFLANLSRGRDTLYNQIVLGTYMGGHLIYSSHDTLLLLFKARERDWRNNNSIQSSLSSDFGWWYYGRSGGRAAARVQQYVRGCKTRAKSPHVSHTFAQLSSRQPTAANT